MPSSATVPTLAVDVPPPADLVVRVSSRRSTPAAPTRDRRRDLVSPTLHHLRSSSQAPPPSRSHTHELTSLSLESTSPQNQRNDTTMGQGRPATPPPSTPWPSQPRRRTPAEVDAAVVRLMLPVLPYTGTGTMTVEDAAAEEARAAELADARPEGVPQPGGGVELTSPASSRRRFAEPSPASWLRYSSSTSTTHDTPPPSYDDLYGPPPSAAAPPRRRTFSFFSSSSLSSSSHQISQSSSALTSLASTPPSSAAPSPTDSGFSWVDDGRPSAQLRRLDSGYSSVASSSRSRGRRGSCASVQEGDEEGKKPSMLKRVGRTLTRERASTAAMLWLALPSRCCRLTLLASPHAQSAVRGRTSRATSLDTRRSSAERAGGSKGGRDGGAWGADDGRHVYTTPALHPSNFACRSGGALGEPPDESDSPGSHEQPG